MAPCGLDFGFRPRKRHPCLSGDFEWFFNGLPLLLVRPRDLFLRFWRPGFALLRGFFNGF